MLSPASDASQAPERPAGAVPAGDPSLWNTVNIACNLGSGHRAEFESAFENLPIALAGADLDGRLIYVNRAFCDMVGWGPSALIGTQPPHPFWTEAQRDGVQDALDQTLNGNPSPSGYEVRFRRRDGECFDVLLRLTLLKNDRGQIYGWLASVTDITQFKRTEDALRKSEEWLRYTLDAASVGTWEWDIRMNEVRWSDNLCRLHGVHPEAGTGTFADFANGIHPDDVPRVLEALQRSIEADHGYDVEYRVNRADGRTRWLEAKGRVIRDPFGQAAGMAGICIDITERRLLEDRFRVAVEASPSAFVMVDGSGSITLVNSQTERLFGYNREEMLGKPLEMLVPERFRQSHPGLRRRFYNDPHARPMGAGFDLYCLRKDGTEVPVEIGLSPIGMPDGTYVLSAIVDITERKRAEDSMRRMNDDLRQKNQEMEQFVYTVSHDLKSPIVTIMGFLGMLKEDLRHENMEQILDSIGRIERATNRMSGLIDDLLQLSRVGRVLTNPETIDVSILVQNIVDELKERIAKHGANVIVQEHMPRIYVDRKRFVDVFENLLTNALKYGCTHVASQVEVGALQSQDEVRFFVRDNGAGIEPAYHTRIFGLFQRLANEQEGTGVGLAIVARIVEIHDGRVWVESTPGHGATFWIALPQDRIRP